MNENQVDSRLVFVDVEAVGTVKRPHIIQIAAIATDRSGNEIAGFEAKAQLPVGCRAKPKHSKYCRSRWASEGQDPQTVAMYFATFLTRNATVERFSKSGQLFRVAQLVAHNANFDVNVLRSWFERLGIYFPASFQPLCTLQRAMWFAQETAESGSPNDYSLISLCHYFGIKHTADQAHDAFADVRATVLLYKEMRNCLSTR